jgi:hypothetical protein
MRHGFLTGEYMIKHLSKYAWVLLMMVGLSFVYYAYDNIIVIPALSPTDPERGWAWLTTDPEVIDYIKYWFRIFGIFQFVICTNPYCVSHVPMAVDNSNLGSDITIDGRWANATLSAIFPKKLILLAGVAITKV